MLCQNSFACKVIVSHDKWVPFYNSNKVLKRYSNDGMEILEFWTNENATEITDKDNEIGREGGARE